MKEEWVSCRSCRGTGVLLLADVQAILQCPGCGAYYATYMVTPKVWREEAGLDPRQHRCLVCLARKINRALTPADFDLRLPINQGIRLGVEMGKEIAKQLYAPSQPKEPELTPTRLDTRLECGLGMDHRWHISKTNGASYCGKNIRHAYTEKHAPTCLECIRLKELQDALKASPPATTGTTPK